MATYPVINKETGEQKEVVLSVHKWNEWCKDNPDWTRDWSDPSTAPMATEVGDWKDKLRNLLEEYNFETESKISKNILENFEKEVENFKQICPIEMLDKLESPINLRKGKQQAI